VLSLDTIHGELIPKVFIVALTHATAAYPVEIRVVCGPTEENHW
jgi:hypothetical protein